MTRLLLVLFLMAVTASAVAAYRDPEQVARATDTISDFLRKRASSPASAVHIPRGQGGEFAVQVRINGVSTPMVIDTGATAVVLTYETAKAIGLPLELLEYDVDVETAGGHTKAARLTLDRLAIGKLVERSVPALVVPHGQMKTNLLGMSFLDRLESWEVRADQLVLRGFPEPVTSRSDRGRGTVLN
jgi:aspartyl protease family protein